MLNLEARVESRFPQWFEGQRAHLARQLLKHLGRLAGLSRIEAFLTEYGHLRGLAFVEAALETLQCHYLIPEAERQRIPQEGRVLIVANHPLGGLDALALLACVGSVRRDVTILGNDVLAAIPGLDGMVLPIPVFEGRATGRQLARLHEVLDGDGALILFPAGEVARLGWRGVRDAPWRPGFIRLAQATRAPVLPMRVEGRNSAWFYAASALYKPLGTALLPREMLAQPLRSVRLRAADPCPVAELPGLADGRRAAAQRVRRAVETLHQREPDWQAPLAPRHRPCWRGLRHEMQTWQLLGKTRDQKEIRLGRTAPDSLVLHELARLRELTFRQVGEGSGRRADTDRYDYWYEHLIVWDAEAAEIAGAYRLGLGHTILSEQGVEGLYSHALFRLSPEFERLAHAGVELGRSFVAPAYQGSRSLDLLWQGIGAWLRHHPEVRYLFGPVSLSAALPDEVRDWLVAYHLRYVGGDPGLAAPRHPYASRCSSLPDWHDMPQAHALQLLHSVLARHHLKMPTLYKQYVDLCEPGGATFLAFSQDPAFNHCTDGLMLLDLQRLTARKRARYLDPAGSDQTSGMMA